jgi:glycosyltransferase involved in cell wall biosynthesis
MQPVLPFQTGGKRNKGILASGSAECPLVTVITAVFNGKQHLAQCIESVMSQGYPNLEHLILDGGSTDGTLDVLRTYEDRIAFWKSEPDTGVYDAWNKGLSLARGEWIAFLGADDEYLPNAVAAYMDLARDNPDADYLSSQIEWLHPSGHSRTIGRPWQWPLFGRYMCSAHVGSMHRKRLFDLYGRFDASYRITGDYEFLLRSRAALRAAFIPLVTVHMRAGGVSDSAAAFREANRAKKTTGGLPKLIAFSDLGVGLLKYHAWTSLQFLLRWFKSKRGATPERT